MKKNAFILIIISVLFQIHAIPLKEFIRDPIWQSGVYLKNVWIGDSRSMLFALPNIYSFAFSEEIGIDAATTISLANSDYPSSTIFRPNNTKLRLSYNYRDFILGTIGFRMPVFTNQFSDKQILTVGGIGTRQLGFQNANLFNSLDLCLGLSSSIAFKDVGEGDLSLGLGLSYLIKGAYTPIQKSDFSGSDADFSPGNEFNTSIAGEYVFLAFDRKITTLADIGFTIYGADKFGENQKINVGGKFNWALFGSTEITEVIPVSVRLANYRKGSNENPGRLGETSKKASDLVFTVTGGVPYFTEYKPYGKITLAGYSGGGASSADNDAFITTLGGGGLYQFSDRIITTGELGFDMGSFGNSGVFGIELSGNVHYKF